MIIPSVPPGDHVQAKVAGPWPWNDERTRHSACRRSGPRIDSPSRQPSDCSAG